MPITLFHPKMRFYPQVNFKNRVNRTFDLSTVCRTLRGKYPFLNLSGMAELRGLSVHVRSRALKNCIRHEFMVFTKKADMRDQPKVVMDQPLRGKKSTLHTFYPDLPAGDRLGMTLFFLIMTRGNGLAGKYIDLEIASEALEGMVRQMKGFKVKPNRYGDILSVKVPKLTPEETAAVEWYWVNVLKCPLF